MLKEVMLDRFARHGSSEFFNVFAGSGGTPHATSDTTVAASSVQDQQARAPDRAGHREGERRRPHAQRPGQRRSKRKPVGLRAPGTEQVTSGAPAFANFVEGGL